MTTFNPSTNLQMNSCQFDRSEYNRQYYQRNKEKLLEKQSERYQSSKGYRVFKEYVEKYLDEDLITIRDILLTLDETDPLECQQIILLMKYVKVLMEIKLMTLGQPQEEIERIRNLPVDT